MPLTAMDIFRLLPRTNCRKCGQPTCLAFAMLLARGKAQLSECPDAAEKARAAIGAALSPEPSGAGERATGARPTPDKVLCAGHARLWGEDHALQPGEGCLVPSRLVSGAGPGRLAEASKGADLALGVADHPALHEKQLEPPALVSDLKFADARGRATSAEASSVAGVEAPAEPSVCLICERCADALAIGPDERLIGRLAAATWWTEAARAAPQRPPAAGHTGVAYRQFVFQPPPPVAPRGVVATTDATFDEDVLGSPVPVLVDFWAEWCGPCRKVAPIIEELARDYAGRVGFAKLDVDENAATPAKFGIMSIPTLILFQGGVAVDKIIGARSKADCKAWIDSKL